MKKAPSKVGTSLVIITLLVSVASLALVWGVITSKSFALAVSAAFSSITNTSTAVGDLTVENNGLAIRTLSLTAKNSSLTALNNSLAASNDGLTTGNKSLTNKNNNLTTANSDLNAFNTTLVDINSDLLTDNFNLRVDNASQKAENALLKNGTNDLSEKIVELIASEATLRVANDILTKKTKELTDRNQTLKNKNRSLDSRLSKALRFDDIKAGNLIRRIASKTAAGTTANIASIPFESIPFYGIGVIVAGTATEVILACTIMQDLKELNTALGNEDDISAKSVCGLTVPTQEEIIEGLDENSVGALEFLGKEKNEGWVQKVKDWFSKSEK